MSGPLLTVPTGGASLAVATRHDAVPLPAAPEPCACRVRASRVPPAVPTTVPSLIILGTDAVLAALPATPVQLAHACMRAGYDTVVPASWGDELIAARVVERLRDIDVPVVYCSCPYVCRRLATHGDSIAPMLLPVVAPPVATAQYLRAIYSPARPRITYAGACPSAAHSSIDVWLSPDELFNSLADRHITTTDQPKEFDSVLPTDRRRYYSEPGGLPSRHALRQLPGHIDLLELTGEDMIMQLAEQLLSNARVIVDIALPLGCCCSGATPGTSADVARARVREQEPPRAFGPVVDHAIPLHLDDAIPSASPGADPADNVSLPRTPRSVEVAPEPTPVGVEVSPRRRSPPTSRAVLGAMPFAKSEGRQLPRAYVARRRSSPRGLRQSTLKAEPTTDRKKVDERKRWIIVGAAGIVVGLALAWVLSALL